MADPINPKPFTQLQFTLAAGAQQQYEVADSKCIYFSEGPGVSPGDISFQFDEELPFRVAPGAFLRIERFDKLRIINNSAGQLSGVVDVSTYADFLFMFFPMGI